MFVDVLDECESQSAARDLMDLLTNIGSRHKSGQPRLKTCISSRHYPNVGVAEPLQMTVEETSQDDITQYIQLTLQRLRIDLGNELATEITSRSRGMFLWAFLVLKRIREAYENGEPRRELRAIIDRTPRRLEEVFREIINDIPTDERERSSLILSWMLFTKRPLSLSELDHALAFRTEYQTYPQYENSDDFVLLEQRKRLLAKYTRGLVETVEIQEWRFLDRGRMPTFRVQFIHESVRQYIYSHLDVVTSGLNVDRSNPGFVDDILARSCFNYIKAVCVETGVINDIARQMRDRPFLEYAIEFGFTHVKDADLSEVPPLYLFEPTIDGVAGNASWWTSFTSILKLYSKINGYLPGHKGWIECTNTQLACACVYQLDSWIKHLLGSNQPNLGGVELSKALCVTAAFGNVESIASLIRAGADVNYDEPMFGSPLYSSLVRGRDDIVAALLGHEAAVCTGPKMHSPLVAAALYCSVDTVRLLLAGGAGVAEREPQETSSAFTFSSQMHALRASIQNDINILAALLPCAEHQRDPVERYKVAYLRAVAGTGNQHANGLQSAVTNLSPGHTMIPIFYRPLLGRTKARLVWADTQISALKEIIACCEGPPLERFVLAYASRVLCEQETLRDYNIQPWSTIHMLPRARWAGIHGG